MKITLLFLTVCLSLSTFVLSAQADLIQNEEHTSQLTEVMAVQGDWKILKTEWTSSDEKHFSDFVAAIGKSGCKNINQCLKGPANPYRSSDSPSARFSSDCADLPYVLRTYFAWKNGLPFGWVSSVEANPAVRADPSKPLDIRYSPNGNHVASRASVITRASATGEVKRANGYRILSDVLNSTSSAAFRVGAASESSSKPTDFYPIKLDRNSLHPGTAIYDPAGHVAVVYSVESDGRILFIDAHPDNSVTRGTYGKKFARSSPGHGAGFKNWRPMRLVGASPAGNGEWTGGKVVPFSNSELKDYSTVQFFGNEPDPKKAWNRGKFVIAGKAFDYYDYLRHVLSSGDLKYDPLNEYSLLLRGLCVDLKDRATSVELAVTRGIHLKEHPARLPLNIYGSAGEWEDYATPSRDARLKTSLKEARDRSLEFIALWKAGDASVVYSGADLAIDLRAVLEKESAACSFSYTKSNGKPSDPLSILDASARAFAMSFDPYHCPELRWGATRSEELATCGDGEVKRRWYGALGKLRNQIERTYDARMDFTLPEMLDPARGGALGVETPPVVDLAESLH